MKTYYNQVAGMVPHLKNFQEDLADDEKGLKGYKGEFLHASRESGTNLLLLDLSRLGWGSKRYSIEEQMQTRSVVFFGNNDYFLHGKDGVVKRISRARAKEVIVGFLHVAKIAEERLKKLNIEHTAWELINFREQHGRTWKAKVIKEWDSSSAPDTLRRLRNHIPDTIKDIEPDMWITEVANVLTNSFAKTLAI